MTTSRPQTAIKPIQSEYRFWWVAVLPAVMMILATFVLALGWSFRLPDDVAMKWSGGHVSSVGPLAGAMGSTLGPALGALVFLMFTHASGKLNDWGRGATIGTLVALSLFLSGSLPVLLTPSLGLSDPWQAPDPGVPALAAVGIVAIVLGTLVAVATRRPAHEDLEVNTSGAESPALWTGTTTGWIFVSVAATGLVLLALGIVSVVPWPIALVGGLFLIAGSMVSRWRVTISNSGLKCKPIYGPGNIQVGVQQGATALAKQISGPLEMLGLGVRGIATPSPQLLLRLGDTLVIQTSPTTSFTISLDGAAEAADCYNDVVAKI